MEAIEIAAALRSLLGAKPHDVEVRDGAPAVVALPGDYKVHDLERLQPRPNRARVAVTVHDSRSLSRYLSRFAGWATVLFADADTRIAVAVIDYHDAVDECDWVAPSHCEHTATYAARFAAAYEKWREAARKPLSQQAFAEFLEDRMADIRAPDAATVMEAVMAFSSVRKVTFRKSIKLSNGLRQLTFHEEEQDTAKGELRVPERIELFVPVMRETEPQPVMVNVRYRIDSEGRLAFGFDIHDQDAVEQEAFDRCVAQVAADHPDVPLYNGPQPS